jgi:hypothetical protein
MVLLILPRKARMAMVEQNHKKEANNNMAMVDINYFTLASPIFAPTKILSLLEHVCNSTSVSTAVPIQYV